MKMKAVLFDFGGVIAEEGFQQGLYAIADKFGLDQKRFFQLANEAVYNSGYVIGKCTEKDYWQEVRAHSGINAPDEVRMRFLVMAPVAPPSRYGGKWPRTTVAAE